MSLWIDKYRPKQLDELSFNDKIRDSLKSLARTGDFPHLLIYGPSGSGKKTRVYATLHELFGPNVEKLKIDVNSFTLSSSRKLEFNVLSSPHHLEITPSDMGNNDRIVIQELLKEVASTEQVDFTNSSKSAARHRFKVVVINEADSLSRDAQAALRRTMEKYSANIRLIMLCNTTSNIISPIKSRTLLIRVPAPTEDEVASVLNNIATIEKVEFKGTENERISFLKKVAGHSDRNLRKAILSFETISMQCASIDPHVFNFDSITLDWDAMLQNITKSIFTNRSVANLAKIRVILYELLAHCIPSRIILKKILFNLIELTGYNTDLARNLTEIGAIYDERLSLGSKSIFHLEGFIAKSMVAIEKTS